MSDTKYTWIQTHIDIVNYLSAMKDNQKELIELLKSVGIRGFNDKDETGKALELEEIDPFTFFCYIYKYGDAKRLEFLQEIAKKISASIPTDTDGVPSAQAQKVWLFPYKEERKNNEIERLWTFFKKAIADEITDEDFKDLLSINSIGLTKLTEALFYINPTKYLPINGPTKPYIENDLGINVKFKTYSEYKSILKHIKQKKSDPFYKISFDSRLLNKEKGGNKIWLYAPGEKASLWDEFYEKGIMGLGWDYLGDLNEYQSKREIADRLNELEKSTGSKMNSANANYDFKNTVSVGDVIIAKKGRSEYLGYGIVSSDYFYDDTRESYRKCRKVKWKKRGVWDGLDHKIVVKTLTDVTKYPDYIQFLKNLIGITEVKEPILSLGTDSQQTLMKPHPLNVIFYGPPGTGKTYTTLIRAAEIVTGYQVNDYKMALKIFNENIDDRIEFITFHQNYSYEDFIQGLRPDTENDNQLTFERKDGVFKRLADRALKNLNDSEKPIVSKKSFEEVWNQFIDPLIEGEVEEIEVKMKKVSFFITSISNKSIDFRKTSGATAHTLSIGTLKKMYDAESVLEIQGLSSYYAPLLEELLLRGKDTTGKKEQIQLKNYVIVIDEINRANISRVFGELITLIEPDKRSGGEIPLSSTLPSGDKFSVPSNLYIIGTMNTADKSIALLDIALRRRFEFESMYPKYEIPGHEIYDTDILLKINEQIIKSKGHDFQIGHAYFMGENKDLVSRINNKIIPLLLEYYMNDEKEVKSILTNAGLELVKDIWPLKIREKSDQSI
ncbi:AAA family ATPase [Albibacterium bauzanense]|uniref:5-methylcytosine-specific restriction protein B n=1 Tax=Albibacterium bauzanense TaxID=653929 RepID=A0A4R1LNM7_9SPHI|nr:AAA family ATPase [Albibacterium bauzanense]TCK80648.1 5-methylcytosine-specific restriction protein B [Albibacterium bauzanense]